MFQDNNGDNIVKSDEVIQRYYYYPFGAETKNAPWTQQTTPTVRYQYNGKEKIDELGLGWNDYGARNYDALLGRWMGVDALAEKYYPESSYSYVRNNPYVYADLDGRDGILIVFPNYKVDTDSRFGKQPLGHAGVLLIDNKTGVTKYYEYGRYNTKDGTKGRVRAVSVYNLKIGADGKPTQESLTKVLGQISKKSGQSGKIEGAYVKGDYDKMNDYAQEKLKESNPEYKEYNQDRKPYSLTGNNCGTFGCDVLKQDPEAKKNAPWIFNPTPNNVAEEYQDNFPKVSYDPQTKTTTSDIYKKENK